MRINRYLSMAGVCSRREADRLIEEGRVTINDRVAKLGDNVEEDAEVRVKGKLVDHPETKDVVILKYHKPAGVVCTSSRVEKHNIIDEISYAKRVFPVGRLDKDSTGLILLTNDGDLCDEILRGRNGHEKEYIVKVHRPIPDSVLKAMEEGVPILDTMTRPCTIHRKGEKMFSIVLTQGLNRQIRRMCEYFGYRVVSLQRIRVMNILLDSLKVGEWKPLTKEEEERLRSLLKGEKFYNA